MKKIAAMSAAAAVVLLAAIAVMAGTDAGKVFRNNVETAFVQIGVQQLQETDSGLKEIEDGNTVLPGEKISYIPRVKVSGVKSYVRLRFDTAMNENSGVRITTNDIYGLGEGWISRGNYFYRTKAMSPGESSDVFRGIVFPQIGNGSACSGFRVTITADAVQAGNFTPDFNSSAPWGSVSVQQSSAGGNVKKRSVKVLKKDELDLMNGNAIECSAEDLFEAFEGMIPGDSRSDRLVLRNRSDDRRDVYFRTDNDEREILKQIRLKIECGKSYSYEGDLASKDLETPVRVATLDPGEETVFQYAIELPATSDNAFQEMNDKVVWIFDSKADAHEQPGKNVKTGDDTGNIMIAALLGLFAVLVLVWAVRKRKKTGKEMRL